MPDEVVVSTEEGTPQGGPLSPLLSNIVLDEFDRELARRGHRFVRYADDCNVYVRSERSGRRVMASVTRFIESRLRLEVNATKSAVARPEERHFLGFRLRRDPRDGGVDVLLSKRSQKRIDEKIRTLTPRTWGRSLQDCIDGLNEYLQGWTGFFRVCTAPPRRPHQATSSRDSPPAVAAQAIDRAPSRPSGGEPRTGSTGGLRWDALLVGAEPQPRGGASAAQRVLREARARVARRGLARASCPGDRPRPGPARAGLRIAAGGNADVGTRSRNRTSRRAGCVAHKSSSVRGGGG